MDVDGTLTDGKIYMTESGENLKVFNVKDGYGIRNILCKAGIEPIIITGRNSVINFKRCQDLDIQEIYQGVEHKMDIINLICLKKNCSFTNIAYIGDDLNDFECMDTINSYGGKIGCPADAAQQIIDISDFVSIHNGGDGAVRDFIDWIILQ